LIWPREVDEDTMNEVLLSAGVAAIIIAVAAGGAQAFAVWG
jgi:hypothetical protein